MNSCRYDSYDTIPARVFFEIRETGNYQLMKPKPSTSTEWLQRMFMQIYDDYFLKSDNKDAARYLELLEKEKALEVKISIFKLVLQFHWETPQEIWNHPTVVKVRRSNIEKLNPYLDSPIDLDGDFDGEVQQALQVSIGIIENDLTEVQMELEGLRGQATKTVFEFYDSLQNIDEVNMQSSDPNLLLPQYVAKERSAIRKMERQRLKNKAA